MKVKITRLTIAQKRQVYPGEIVDVSKEEAVQLIAANKGIPIKESPVETADLPKIALETADAPISAPEAQAEAPEPEPEPEAKPRRARSKKVSE